MARVNVYLPDDLAAQARAAEVNISRITQGAIRAALAAVDTDRWIDHLARAPIVRHQLAGLLLGTWAAREQWRLADTLDAELSNVLPAVLVTTDGRLVAFSTVLVAFLRAHLPIALAGELRAEKHPDRGLRCAETPPAGLINGIVMLWTQTFLSR